MNSDKIAKLENSTKLKKKVFGRNIWKNYAFIPPSIVMFVGILGIVYLLNLDKLVSLYSIPFILIFFIGTIWLKSTKRYLVNQKIENTDEFLICLSIPFLTRDKKTVILFSSGKNRNNRYFLEKEKKDILADENIETILKNIDSKPKQINDTNIFITQLPLNKKFSGKIDNEYWIIFTGNNSIEFITQSELNKYLK